MRLPELIALEQCSHARDVLHDPPAVLAEKLRATGLTERLSPGDKVAVGVGSRGINGLPGLVAAIVREVRARGAEPVIVPCMGSHGGATDNGRRSLLARLGVTGEACGAPVADRVEAVDLGPGSTSGAHLYTARQVLDADYVILLNRVKSHTSYRGPVESGLSKMLVVGLGQEPGARSFHLHAQSGDFSSLLTELVAGLTARLNLLAGVAVLEDQSGHTLDISVAPPELFGQTDRELLARYRSIATRLPFPSADLLIVERIGKDISGTGMDTNVIGRVRHLARSEPESPRILRIWARSLSEASEGNATGIGLADFISRRLAANTDMRITIRNALNALAPERAFLPPCLEPEQLVLDEALRSAGVIDPERSRLAWIQDTSRLERMLVSPSLAENLDPACPVRRLGRPLKFAFDSRGELESFESHLRKALG